MSRFGKLLYKLYFQPKNQRALVAKFGGKSNYAAMLAAEQEMKSYALYQLTIKSNFNPHGKYKINFLTGDRFLHQTLFCTYSFFKFLSPEESMNFSVNYYSDGSLSAASAELLKSRFPGIRVIGIAESTVAVQQDLPESLFPYLRKKIDNHPLFKKLVFPHVNHEDGFSTFFDSDMLFIRRPTIFLDWLYQADAQKNPAFCIQDVGRSYGYSEPEIKQIWPSSVQHNINSGMYTICENQIDFSFIEKLVKAFEENFGSQYFLEQLITSILLEKTGNLFVAPKNEYIVLPGVEQITDQAGTLHHYVNESKEFYFKESWKKQLTM